MVAEPPRDCRRSRRQLEGLQRLPELPRGWRRSRRLLEGFQRLPKLPRGGREVGDVEKVL